MNQFTIIKQLGKGAFGTVHLCEQNHNKRKVVIKTIETGACKGQLGASKNEVLILKSLNHPNVIQYFDSFLKCGVYYIVMEYAVRGSLYEFIRKHKPNFFDPQLVINFFCQILMGLHHIHSKKIIHRDLKSENIFLTGMKGDVIKIGDFGISKTLPRGAMANTFIGTANYLAPEMCDGRPYNSKSDIWSLGCILFEMCAMERLFNGPVTKVVLSIMGGKRKTVDVYTYGEQMQMIIDDMLRVNPDERPDTLTLMTYRDIFPSMHLLSVNLGNIV